MCLRDYLKVRATDAKDDDDSVAELEKDYDMSDPERSKIMPLSAKERCALFDRLAAAVKSK